MKTIREKLLGITRSGASSPYRQTIHISNAYGEDGGWMCIDVSDTVNITFKLDDESASVAAPQLEKYTTGESKVVAIGAQIQITEMSFFRFIGKFSLLMTISDISKVVKFDGCATLNEGINKDTSYRYKGFCMRVQDLPKLSLTEMLGLRYSLDGMPSHAILDLTHFANLKRLWLGCAAGEQGATSGSIKHVCLSDEVMETLKVLNISSEYVPANITRLSQAISVVISNPSSSWAQVQGSFLPLPATVEIEIHSQNINDLATIRRAILGWGADFAQTDVNPNATTSAVSSDNTPPPISIYMHIDPIYESEVNQLRVELSGLFSATHVVNVQRI